jgi:5-methylcytosine-specific restriction endonuclease McrA
MPFDRKKYPNNWTSISRRIRELAGKKCEFCGAENYAQHPITGSRVVLTVAHLDHDTTNNRRENLRALCQRCHLRYDSEYHKKNAANTRRRKKLAGGQTELFGNVAETSDKKAD